MSKWGWPKAGKEFPTRLRVCLAHPYWCFLIPSPMISGGSQCWRQTGNSKRDGLIEFENLFPRLLKTQHGFYKGVFLVGYLVSPTRLAGWMTLRERNLPQEKEKKGLAGSLSKGLAGWCKPLSDMPRYQSQVHNTVKLSRSFVRFCRWQPIPGRMDDV